MKWRSGIVAAVVAVLVSMAPAVADDGGGTDWDLNPNPGLPGVDLGGDETIPGTPGGGSGGGGGGGGQASDPNVQYRWVDHPTPCVLPNHWYHQERRVRSGGAWGAWESTGRRTTCVAPEEAPEEDDALPEITPQMIRDRAQSLAPRPVVSIEPATKTFVNIPTNFSATPGGGAETVEILGRAVTITFTPVSTTWSFGDGGSATGDGIHGAAVGQSGAVEHEYRRGGARSVTASRSFTVSAQVPGAGTITLDQPIVAASAPYALTVGEIQSLVTGLR